MNYPRRRNALSLKHMTELTDAFRHVGDSPALGVILAANGPAFSAGHDFADMVGQDIPAEKAHADAYERMIQHALHVGANAIIAVRYDATEISADITEVLCYGTAVVVEPLSSERLGLVAKKERS